MIPLSATSGEHWNPGMSAESLFAPTGFDAIGRSMYSKAAFGDASQSIAASLRRLELPVPPSRNNEPVTVTKARSLDEALFDARAAAKELTSIVAMHLDPEWRKRLFAQLDSLHDPMEWEKGDIPLQRSSFNTFLRTICFVQPKCRPGLGLSAAGHLIAVWLAGCNRLTIEFLPSDGVKIVLSNNLGNYVERAAISTKAELLLSKLAPYQPDQWFGR